MITNIIGMILTMVVTNVHQPTQYWHESNIILCTSTYIVDDPCSVSDGTYMPYSPSGGYWSDGPSCSYGWGGEPKTRLNPDVRIIEVHEIRTLEFECEGHKVVELSDKLLSKTRRERKVTTQEEWIDVDVLVAGTATGRVDITSEDIIMLLNTTALTNTTISVEEYVK